MNWNLPHNGVNTFQIIFVPICAIMAMRGVLRVSSGRVPRRSGIFAVLVWAGAALSIALPDMTSLLANWLGINRGADLVFYIAILGGISICFYFYQRNRHLENLITELIRREAIREAQFSSRSAIGEFQRPVDNNPV